MNRPDYVKCIRCDTKVSTNPREHDGLILTFDYESSAVKVCDECTEIVDRRNYWN